MPPLISRGFRGRRDDAPAGRVPPGQYVTPDFPVLSAGPTPHTPLEQWDFSIVGEVDEPRRWTWEEFRALPSEDVTVPGWPGHRAGQHVDVRLTAEDGYQAQRSYSIASAPDGASVELTVERLDDGEVSLYLTDELRPGDQIELRGPIGGYFVWEPSQGGPLLLVAGGSGVAPLMATIRAWDAAGSDGDTRLVFSSRRWDDVIYREELERLDGHGLRVIHTLTRSHPPGWTGYARRVDAEMLAEVGPSPVERPRVYVCGSTLFVEAVAGALVELGHEPQSVKTERFGPTGD